MRRILTYMLTLAMVVSALSGCGEQKAVENGGVAGVEDTQVKTDDVERKVDRSSFVPEEDPVEQTNDSLRILTSTHVVTERLTKLEEQFHEKYPDVEIQYLEPMGTDEESRRDYFTKTATEIMAGEGPDLVIADSFADFEFENIYKMVQAGAFYDLNNFLLPDENFQEEDYVSAALEAGQFSGKQYLMPHSLGNPYYITTEEILKTEGINPEDITDYSSLLEQFGGFAKEHALPATFGPTRNDTLYLLNYADVKEGTADAENDNMRKAMENYGTIYTQDVNGSYGFESNVTNLTNDICNLVFWEYGYEAVGTMGALNRQATPYVIPVKDINGEISARINKYCAISAQSKNKQLAYDYMMMSITMTPLINDGNCGIPVYKPSYHAIMDEIKKCMADGNFYPKEMQEDFQMDLPVEPLTEDQYQQLDAIYNQIKHCVLHSDADTIFQQAVMPYLEGKASLETCLADAQSKLEVYLSE